jgi:NAD(P)-dependent dehydrogenase (short-subunit alcohol dehydrogenase family)
MTKIAIVTGATSGLGLETARQLGEAGYEVGLVGRNPDKGREALASIGRTAATPPVLFQCDMADLSQVRRVAGEIAARFTRIDVLVNNAGVINIPRRVTVDGYEETFAVNHLAHFLLTGLLLPYLRAAAPSRIIVVSSNAHVPFRLHLDDLMSERFYTAFPVYGRTKLANLYFAYALAQRLAGTGVTVNAVHPGAVASSFSKNNGWLARASMAIGRPFFMSSAQAAETPVWMATAPELAETSGKYFYKGHEIRSTRRSHDRRIGQELWRRSEALTGLAYPQIE